MSGSLAQNRLWMAQGWEYFSAVVSGLSAEQLSGPSELPGWTGRHVLAHVAFNARALGRLAHWARTGEKTPMYAGAAERAEEIAAGADLEVPTLRAAAAQEQSELDTALTDLPDAAWAATVTTAQGRSVPATVIPWLRARELWIHALDLRHGADFSDLPPDFLDALITDVLSRRRAVHGERIAVRATDRPASPPQPEATTCVEGRAADVARWLTRRATAGVRAHDGSPLPHLEPWL